MLVFSVFCAISAGTVSGIVCLTDCVRRRDVLAGDALAGIDRLFC